MNDFHYNPGAECDGIIERGVHRILEKYYTLTPAAKARALANGLIKSIAPSMPDNDFANAVKGKSRLACREAKQAAMKALYDGRTEQSGQLFDIPESLSPKLAWMREHGVVTYYHATWNDNEPTWFAGFQEWWPDMTGIDFFATETARNGDSRIGEGETEDAALIHLISGLEIKHWSITP